MGRFIFKRFIQTIIILMMVSVLAFALIQFIPGDPVYVMLGENISKEYHDTVYSSMGLDKPLVQQYFSWLWKMLHGDMGYSYHFNKNVNELIASRLPVTLILGVASAVVSIVLGILFGTITAVKRGTLTDTVITVLANVGLATPNFWIAVLLVLVFSIHLKWLPSYGFTLPWVDFGKSIRQMILPVICMSLGGVASYTRQMRSSMLEVIHQDYVRTARSKGLPEGKVLWRYAIKNSLIPILTMAGTTLRGCIGGSAIVETMFNIVGMGQIMVIAINFCDYQLLQSGLLFMAAITCLCNLLVDIAYAYADPRIRLE
ncbi:MAG: ABC transporter permease [bacterium]|nr:ABC transporter permease [Roseburia sp.]MCM1098215.1 ABC transporter permease [Ruminococcus flavefaciens]MCM1190044.1 ABC transporter permease [bacterium]